MPQFLITGPDGQKYKVTGETAEGALAALKKHLGDASPLPQGRADHWGSGYEGTDFLTMGGSTKAAAAGVGLMNATIDAMKGNGFNYSDEYNKSLAQQRADQLAYETEHPYRAAAGKAGGVALGVARAPVVGSGLMGAVATGAGYGTAGGALQDADSIGQRIENTLLGTRTGAGLGVLGYGAGKLLGWGVGKANDWYKGWGVPAEQLAQQRVFEAAQATPGARGKLLDLGPEGVAADALGQRGTALGRRAANLDPDAREVINDTMLGRKAGQNIRVVTDMEKIAGIKPGAEKTVEQMVEAVDDKFRPQLDDLYTQARNAGRDMPLQFFDDVLNTPQGKAVFNEAVAEVKARASLNGTPENVSNLAIIDTMKKIFDSKATSAYASADKATGNLWRDFAKNLRTRADAYMDMQENPIYAQARSLAQQREMAKEAITVGESLGSKKVPVDVPGKVDAVDLGNRQRVAQGYVAKKSDSLLNSGATEGAIADLSTPMGKRAADAALGKDNLAPTVSRERTFNSTARQLLGNSTTAQQLMDDGASVIPRLLGNPVGTAKDMVAQLVAKFSTEKQRAMAPVVARILMSRNIPAAPAIPPTIIEKMLNAGDEKAAKAVLITWEGSRPNPGR